MDQVPRIFAQRPWTLVIARDSKAQVRWNPVGRGDQHRGCAGRKTANTLLWLNVYQIQSQNLWLYCQLAVSCMSHGWGIANLSVQVAAVRKQKLAITPKRWDNRQCRRTAAGNGVTLTLPYQSPRYPFHNPNRGCGAPNSVGSGLDAIVLFVPRERVCGRCPCDPFRAAQHTAC